MTDNEQIDEMMYAAEIEQRRHEAKPEEDKMMKPTKANIDKALHAAGFPDDFEIVKGDGYIYFSGGDSVEWYSTSVMEPYLNRQTVDQWVESAKELQAGR